jgi:hypothetical protein
VPTTTTLGFRVPLDSDPVCDGAEATRNLGQDVDDFVGVLAAGTINITLTAVTFNSAAITFPVGRFASAPIVVASLASAPGGSNKLTARCSGVTAAGATLFVYSADGTNATATVAVNWIAIKQ